MKVRVLPVTNVTGTCEPTFRLWSSAKPLSTKAPSAPRFAITSCEPSVQSIVITSFAPGVTAVVNSFLPKTSDSPVRTLPTAVTPGALAAASPTDVGIGE